LVSESKSPRPAFALAVVFLAAIGDVGAPQVDLDHDLRGDGRPTKLSGVFRNVFADAGATSIVAPADGSRPQRLADVPVTYHLRYVHTDALGSPVVETNAIGEEITGTRTLYEPYGTPLTTPRDGAPSYTGHQYDTGTGLIYAQQRYYDPQLGVFYSPDPMAVDTTSAFNFNRYAYANNSPYKFTDPDGREPDTVGSMEQWADPAHMARNEVTPEAALAVSAAAVGMIPVVGDAVAIGQAIAAPTAANIISAGVGLVPVLGDMAGAAIKAARGASEVAQASRAAGGMTAGLVTRSGETFTGASARAGGPGAATNGLVQNALDSVPAGSRSDFHGCCAEINAMSNAANAGADLNGSVVAAVRATGSNAGTVQRACPSCAGTAERLGVTTVNPD